MMPASLNVLRCQDRRDCAKSRSAIRSQTHRSPSSSSVTTSTRIWSASAWKSCAARSESIRVDVAMAKYITSFLDVSTSTAWRKRLADRCFDAMADLRDDLQSTLGEA